MLCLCLQDVSKSPKNMKKLLPKRKPERKPSEEDVTVRKSTCRSLRNVRNVRNVMDEDRVSSQARPLWRRTLRS